MNKPKIGDRVTAYFKGDLTTKTLEYWDRRDENKAVFYGGYELRWSDYLGWLFG